MNTTASDKKTNFLGILSNEAVINDRTKYTILQRSCAAVHFSFMIIFAALGVMPMVIFNIVSTVMYLLSSLLIKKEKYMTFYYMTFLEVCLHAYAATILCGWETGFGLYIIAMTPVVFYMHFSLKNNSVNQTFVIGICAMLAFITCRILSWETRAPYPIDDRYALYLYIFNSICTFSMLLFFSMMFLREMKRSHDDLEEENAKLDAMASHDALTGLYNRRSMDTFLKKADVSGKTFSIIMCDIDDFKKVNDTYGHEAGDVVLKNVSRVISSSLREGDYVCRWGGEEILILATGTSLASAAMAAERIRRNIENTDNVSDDTHIKCTITVGAAESSEATSISDVINLADERLYKGKKSGKNRVITE